MMWVRSGKVLASLCGLLIGATLALEAAAQAQQTPAPLNAEAAKQLRAEADQAYLRQEFDRALELYLRVYANFSDDLDINLRIAQVFTSRPKEEYRKAIPYLRKAYQIDRTNLAVIRDLAALTSWAGLFSESIPLHAELVRRSPDTPVFRLQLARVLSWAGRTDEAISAYSYYVTRVPSDLTARVELGRLLAQQKDYAGATEHYRYVLSHQPGNVTARFGQAQVLAWRGDLKPALEELERVLASEPRHFDARILKAYIFAWQGGLEDSRKLFQALARENPRSADAREGLKYVTELEQARAAVAPPPGVGSAPAGPKPLELAEVATGEQRYEEAIKLYREHLKQSPEDRSAQLRLAQVLSWNLQYEESESLLKELIRKDPSNTEAVLHLARVLTWDGKLDEGVEQYRRALALGPESATLHLELARVHSWRADSASALDEYRRALALEPANVEAQRGVVQGLIWNEELESAQREFESFRARHPSDPEIASLEEQIQALGARRARASSPEVAEDYFRALVEKDPSDTEARLALAEAYLGSGNYAAAARELGVAREQKPEDDSIRLRLARVLSWNREYPESIRLYREHVAQNPHDIEEHVQLARVLSWSGNYEAAAEEYREVLKERPEHSEARLELARTLTWARRYPQAMQELETLQREKGRVFEVLLGKGRVYTAQSRWREAVAAFDAALAIKPGDREALTGKGQALLWSGDGPAAREILTQLRAEDPDDPTVLVALAAAENSLLRPDRALSLLSQVERTSPGHADARILREQIQANLRPELRLTSGYLRDSDALNTWRYTLDFRFSLHPRLRNFVTVDYMPSSALAGLFGYRVSELFAPRVPTDPFVPSPTLLDESDFPSEILLPGGARFGQSAAQFLAGGSMRVSRSFGWTAGAGAVELRHGSQDFSAFGLPASRTRFIYTVTPSFFFGNWELALTSSRQFWAYTPKAIAQSTHMDELSGNLAWNPDTRTRISFLYYYRRLSPTFEIPTLPIFDSTFTTQIGTFEGRTFKKMGHGGLILATRTVGKWEKGDITIGYDGMAFGYRHPSGLPSPEFFLNPGIFTPSFYQRHAGLARVVLKPTASVAWDIHGTVGAQQFFQGTDFAFSSTAGSRLDIGLGSHTTLSLAYEYFNAASTVQALALGAAPRAYHSNYASVGLHFRF